MSNGATADRHVPDSPTAVRSSGWRQILRRALREFKHDEITDRAAALTYFGVLSVFPALLAVVSLLGLLGRGTTDRVLTNVESLTPGSVKSFITTAIDQTQNLLAPPGARARCGGR